MSSFIVSHPLSYTCVRLCFNRTIYEKLASAFTEEMAALYRQRVDEISPNIRYCAYNIGESPTGSVRQSRAVLISKCTNRVFVSQVTRMPSMT